MNSFKKERAIQNIRRCEKKEKPDKGKWMKSEPIYSIEFCHYLYVGSD